MIHLNVAVVTVVGRESQSIAPTHQADKIGQPVSRPARLSSRATGCRAPRRTGRSHSAVSRAAPRSARAATRITSCFLPSRMGWPFIRAKLTQPVVDAAQRVVVARRVEYDQRQVGVVEEEGVDKPVVGLTSQVPKNRLAQRAVRTVDA